MNIFSQIDYHAYWPGDEERDLIVEFANQRKEQGLKVMDAG